MDSLKKVLTVMVVILVALIAVGGIYTASMGGMNHSKTNVATGQNQTQTAGKQEAVEQKAASSESSSADSNKVAEGQKTAEDQSKAAVTNQEQAASSQQTTPEQAEEPAKTTQQPNNQPPYPAVTPVIIQNPPPTAQTDQRIYVEQLKERVKAINEANAQIAGNTGMAPTVVQQNGSVVSSGQTNMNELHQGFYKLGQNISAMEQTLDNLSQDVQQPNYYPVPSNGLPGQNYYQYNPYYPYLNNQAPQGQQPNQQGQNQTQNQTGQPTDQVGSMDPNMQMDPNTPMNHGLSLTNLFNTKNLSTTFTLILIGSLILGIVAIIGFISSLFKPKKASQEGMQI